MMKKLFAVLAALAGILSVTAFCGARDITMEELYQANETAALAENYESMRYTADTYDSAGELTQRIEGQYIYGAEGWKYEETCDYIVSEASSCGLSDDGNAAFYYTYRRDEWKEGDVTKTVTILPAADFKEFVSGYSSLLRGCYGVDILNVKEDGDTVVIETEAYYPGDNGEKLSPWSIVYTADAETLALRSIEENMEDGGKAVTTFVYNDPVEFTCAAKTVCETAAEGTTDLTVTILEKDQDKAVQDYTVGNDTGVFFNSVYGCAFYNDEAGSEPIDSLTLTGDPLEIYALAGIESGE